MKIGKIIKKHPVATTVIVVLSLMLIAFVTYKVSNNQPIFSGLGSSEMQVFVSGSGSHGARSPKTLMAGSASANIFSAGQCRTVGDTEYCCDDPNYPVMCDINTCGVSQAWCNNHQNGGGHCKASDPDWCCWDSGYVVCGETDTCGPSQAWCSNFLDSNHKSCNTDSSRCCNNEGAVYDYGANVCCPPTSPYYNGNNGCVTTPQSVSDNYYTRNSDCFGTQETCNGNSLSQCQAIEQWLYKYVDMGVVSGKCGVECTVDTECGTPVNSDPYCKSNNVYINVTTGQCFANKCQQSSNEQLQQACQYGCDNGTCTEKPPVPILLYAILAGIAIITVVIIVVIIRSKRHRR